MMNGVEILQQLDREVQRTLSYTWNDKSRRFADKKTGQFISQKSVKSLLSEGIYSKTEKLTTLASKLASGDIELDIFTLRSAQLIKELHILNAVYAANGRADQMSKAQLDILTNRLSEQLKGAIDPLTGERYGLKELIKDISSGDVSEAQLKNRLRMYADSAKLTQNYIQAQHKKDQGFTQAFRSLGGSHVHCASCVSYASLGWVSLEDIIYPGEKCECRSQCKCSLEYK